MRNLFSSFQFCCVEHGPVLCPPPRHAADGVDVVLHGLLALVAVRLLLLPMKFIFKLLIHSACGFLCLWLLNSIAGFTGIFFPINAVTVLTAGILGLPGVGILALLAILP